MRSPVTEEVRRCERCRARALVFADYCGAWRCEACDDHPGFSRCYCGWRRGGGDGRRDLIECGETIDPID